MKFRTAFERCSICRKEVGARFNCDLSLAAFVCSDCLLDLGAASELHRRHLAEKEDKPHE